MNHDSPLTPDDPRLTAFALGELEGAEHAAVAAQVAASDALQREVERIRTDAEAVRAQLRAAEPALSAALESRLLAQLANEAEARVVDDGIAARALRAGTLGGQPDAADWREGLGRDARRRVLWWSPFVMPLAACLVAVAAVGLLWRDGHQTLETAEIAFADALPQPKLMHTQVESAAAPVQARAMVAESAPAPSALLSQWVRKDLFAPRVWAYGHGGVPVRDSVLSAPASLPYGEEESLVVAVAAQAGSAESDADVLVASDSGSPVAATLLPATTEAVLAAFTEPAEDAGSAALAEGATLYTASAPVAADMRARAVAAPASARATVAAAPVLAELASAGGGKEVEASAKVLAEAVALVRPVPAAAVGNTVAGADVASTTSLARTQSKASGATPAAMVEPAVAQSLSSAQALSSVEASLAPAIAPAAAVAVPATGFVPAADSVPVVVAAVADATVADESEGGEGAAVQAAALNASQIAALAAARHFSQASLEELEAAAFASDGQVWRAGSDQITAAAAQLARADQAASAGINGAGAASYGRQPARSANSLNLASRYVQAKLWVEAGQLPPSANVDVDAIVRDAVPLYAQTALRRLRAQAGAKLLAESGAATAGYGELAAVPQVAVATLPSGSVPVADPATGSVTALADSAVLTAQELAQLEAQSVLLRLVRSYATVLKDRPADAQVQLDAIAAQVRARPRLATSRNGQEFLKLLETTRELF